MEERQAAAKMSGVKITDHRIPKKVFDELEALSAVADEVGNFEHITEGTFKSVEVLEMFDIPGDKHNAARKVRQLKMPLLKRGYTIEQSGHSWVITEIQKEETK